jgi:hypothetical protein
MIDQLETAVDKLMGRQVANNTYDLSARDGG